MSTLSSGKLLQDLTAVIDGAPAGLVLPKVSDPLEVQEVHHYLCALEVQRGSPLHSTFIPSRAEIERDRRIVEVFESAPDTGVLSLDGEMLDRPHLVPAQRVLALARRA